MYIICACCFFIAFSDVQVVYILGVGGFEALDQFNFKIS